MLVLLIFGLMIVFIAMDIPVAFALGLTSLGFIVLGTNVPLILVVQRLYTGVDSFTLLAVPLFILTGVLMNYTSLSKKIVDFSMAMVGFIRGGLAAVNIVTSMFFAGVSGTSMADTAAVGGVLIPAMIEKGYKADFTGAVTASSSTIGIIIPPSVPMILYGVFVGLSVTTLFIAGIIPGVLIGLGLILVAFYISRKAGYSGESAFSAERLWQTFKAAIPALLLPVIILGGIMGGIFTPTEAAAVAVVYVLVVGTLGFRELSLRNMYDALKESALFTGQVMLIIAVASLLGWVFAYAKIPQMLVSPIVNITTSNSVFLWLASLVFVVAGTFLHGTAMLVVLVPLFLPVVQEMGIHPLQFAMVVMMCWGIGQQTPPVGSALYITCSLAKIDMWELTRANMPFIAVLFVVLAGVIHLPSLFVLLIPGILGLL
ncbi:C4-dicarboxylate ABC transporter permease [candidate division KSB3 bacterium]|uniref:C4-dicarboxylate ABC transporter permease n=1 Tax=candidate division KSB3 bacterium TaxID=2044937 RepID=A0A2G6E1A1_9BACT|nr:MAG: C4-dicarboxylate ABC transporter permease [candidate division KSB3 bacterium]PIE28476.1 MAG: C4-dicarboxylate ABC transporter permease [candidate division KSB3 bacterium]